VLISILIITELNWLDPIKLLQSHLEWIMPLISRPAMQAVIQVFKPHLVLQICSSLIELTSIASNVVDLIDSEVHT
jgi:uncharacterized membrane protein